MSDIIKIYNAILHVLDNEGNILVLSDKELEADSVISEFLEKHIDKLMNDSNIKNASFIGEHNDIRDMCQHLLNNRDDFIEASVYTSQRMFEIMTANCDIAPADLICCLFDYCNQLYYGMLKMNYKMGFTHYVQAGEAGNINQIIRYKTILPSESQRIEECVFVSLDDLNIKLIEKAYDINGEKDFYLSKMFLQCSANFSDNEKLKIIDKAAKKINRKFFDDDFEKAAKLQKVVSESLEATSTIEINEVAKEVFENNIEIQNEYIEEIKKAGITDATISVAENVAEKKYKSLKIKTDTGIEINCPSSYYGNNDKLEFINNPDGTISILIKNVGKIM